MSDGLDFLYFGHCSAQMKKSFGVFSMMASSNLRPKNINTFLGITQSQWWLEFVTSNIRGFWFNWGASRTTVDKSFIYLMYHLLGFERFHSSFPDWLCFS